MSSFTTFDFTNIAGYPNQMLKFKDIREFLVFSDSSAIIASQHWDGMERCFMLTDTSHLDVKFKAFASSLTGDVTDWFKSLLVQSIATDYDLKKKLFDSWQENKDPVMLNNALMTIKEVRMRQLMSLIARLTRLLKSFL